MLRRFFSYYQPYKTLFLLDFGCAIVSGLLELGFPMAVKLFVDRLLLSQEWLLIILASAGLLVIYVLNTGLMAVVTYWGHMLGINIETEMRRKAFDHLQKLSFGYFDNQKTGHLVGRLTKDLEEIGEVAHHGPEDLFIAVMTFLGAFALMLTIHVELALITAIVVPKTPAGACSTYYKICDRESYAFALASAAVALEMDGGVVKQARIALGGVATVPWRATAAEASLAGRTLTPELALAAGHVAFADAKPGRDNGYKIELGARTVADALMIAAGRNAA